MKTKIFFFCLFITASLPAQISKFESNAKNFEFEEMKLGNSLSDFLNKYPGARKLSNDNDKYGVILYEIDELKTASYGYFYFFENKLYLANIVYNESKLDSFGGAITLVDRLMSKLGKETSTYEKIEDDKEKVAAFWWKFKNIERYFEIIAYKDGSIKLLFDDSIVIKKIKEKKAQAADVGF